MLETIWFIIWGVLWTVYFVLDGFDLGLGALMPALAKTEEEKRTVYNSMGPFWDGNEVWLITAGGVTFAAFPGTYAVMFSTLYAPLLWLLFALIFRGIAMEYRGHMESERWRGFWDLVLSAASFLPALLLGVAFANIFQGVPFDTRGVFHGSLLTLLNPYGLLGGVLFVLLFMVHGCLWLAARSTGALRDRAAALAGRLWWALAAAAVAFFAASWKATSLYANYLAAPALFLIPAVAVAALLATRFFLGQGRWWRAWTASAVTIAGAAFFGVAGLYPALYPSSLDPAATLTAFNSSSSPLTLKIMLGVALVLVPVVIAYQAWTYRTFAAGPAEAGGHEEGY
ncbi:cytochrome d ubiquinol oxidase subunit II [Dissulfurirhabdus thermomarina]|uniref:Cytochrome d ubiquinol oxidase subunit II n=1 Tax=Dissulfurirhabdus thermomarina TaxID=1765737 RepID=A0A6N9TTY0_DISTH|nr:cytochrome d ubiquinol oxidase subunit II [Dissulfurirhabdus thermomarina]NDY41956.1 cytochrome d ubiquinol oxidase subunit II [Dissulfurirhabdus thermomarina]NMX22940.1 cytochrome d ubiquinol oxidase subunit II [Dissulfurirhabdus thermomarina]